MHLFPGNSLHSSCISPVALSSSDFISLLRMSKTSGGRIIPCSLFASSFTSPEDVVLLMIEFVNSRKSYGSCDACYMANDFSVEDS